MRSIALNPGAVFAFLIVMSMSGLAVADDRADCRGDKECEIILGSIAANGKDCHGDTRCVAAEAEQRAAHLRLSLLIAEKCNGAAEGCTFYQEVDDATDKTASADEAANAARLAANNCPASDKDILALSDKEFERCEAVHIVGGTAGASYLAASSVRLRAAADADWERKVEKCRGAPGCTVIEGRFRP